MLTDGRTTDAGVTGILIAHLGAFGSGELITDHKADDGQIINSHKVCIFMFSQRIILRNWNRLSRLKDTLTHLL